ncbi:MAG: TRAP transporter large permease [Planctomycetes bacterium]|nr:TRAP transporter large permease [Planctomycetota bacterium]
MLISVFVVGFITLLVMGVPVAFAMGGTAILSGVLLWGIEGLPIDILTQRAMAGVNNFTTLAIPLFLLSGKLMNAGTITDRIFNFAQSAVGGIPGGLGHVNILASVIFAGMSGTAAADAAGLGAMEIKAMTNAGFDKDFSVAVTGASSLVGPIIPPSVPMVMYGVLTGTSVSSLFIGGILPGLVMSLGMSCLVVYYARKRNYPRGERFSWSRLGRHFKLAAFPLLTPAIIMGGIWTGIFTSTEAAGVAVVYALLLIVVVYRTMGPMDVWRMVKRTVIDCASILFIIACTAVYGYVLIRTQIPMLLAESVFAMTKNPIVIIFLLIGFLMVIGCFMSTMESIILFVPIFLPLLQQARIDLLVFGIIMCLTLMIGQLTPPFGTVLFVLAKISDVPMDRVVRVSIPFTIPVLVTTILCALFPKFVTFLPMLAK